MEEIYQEKFRINDTQICFFALLENNIDEGGATASTHLGVYMNYWNFKV